MKGERILIDTSVWIAYFKDRDSRFSDKVDEFLTSAHICVPKVVIAELIQGAKSEKEIAVIKECFEAFTVIEESLPNAEEKEIHKCLHILKDSENKVSEAKMPLFRELRKVVESY